MIAKIRICVCPVPGCATIGKTPSAGCPTHPGRALVKEVYVHQRDTKAATEADATIRRMFGGRW